MTRFGARCAQARAPSVDVAAVLARIKYVSRFARPLSAAEIEAIVIGSQRRNMDTDLTGVLLAYGGVFMQILEGDPVAVETALSRIARDPRHRNLVVVRSQRVETRLFDGWSMRLLELDADARNEARPLLRMIDAVGHGDARETAALYDLDDMLWRIIGERGATLRRAG